ncbi:MAG: DUF3343 domain-containing protein [Eubacteriales bacterium]
MNQYVATFHTHFSAMQSCRELKKVGVSARMAPVPRQLSSSCGTCVRYSGDDPKKSLLHEDLEEIYVVLHENYQKIQSL